MYVRVSTEMGRDQQAIFVPQRAIQRGTDGMAHVMTISAEGMAEERLVQTGAMQGNEWQITDGLPRQGDREGSGQDPGGHTRHAGRAFLARGKTP